MTEQSSPDLPPPPAAAVFLRDGDRFIPTKAAGSPWSDGLVHGGPPAGLLARSVERFAAQDGMQVTRLTVDLFRPVPAVPLTVSTRSIRAGNRIHAVEASLLADGQEVTRATALLLRTTEIEMAPPSDFALPPGPEGIETSNMSGSRRDTPLPAGFRPGFHSTIEVKRVTMGGPAGNTAWIRIPIPFVEGEETTPLVRIAATSDFGSAFSGMGVRDSVPFINADITLYLHRLPEGEWIGLQSARRAEPSGIGVAAATFFDPTGPVGRSVHALLHNQRR